MEIGRQAIARSMSDRMVQSPTSVTKSPVALDTLHDNADRIGTVDKAGCSTATMEPNRPTDVGQLVAQLVAERMAHCVTNRDRKVGAPSLTSTGRIPRYSLASSVTSFR